MGINRPTVIVLGAGASKEYKFPLGSELIDGVRRDLRFTWEHKMTSGDPAIFEALQQKYPHEIQRYVDAANQLASVVHHYPSVDEAIHLFSGQNEAVEVGKLAIARQLILAEKGSPLWQANHIDCALDGLTGWMPRMFSLIIGSLTRREISNAFDNLVIINFNYDRSFEHFLHASIQSLGIASEVASEILSKVKFYRPYGSLGRLPWQDRQAVGFGNVRADLWTIASGLRTYTEQNHNEKTIEAIRESLKWANVVLFLGFGFHKQNVEMMQIERDVQRPKSFITAVGIDPKNYPAIKDRITGLFRSTDSSTFEIEEMTCEDLFKKRGQSISLALG